MNDDYDRDDDFRRSIEFAYQEIRRRVANGGPGWRGYPMRTLGDFAKRFDETWFDYQRRQSSLRAANNKKLAKQCQCCGNPLETKLGQRCPHCDPDLQTGHPPGTVEA